VISLIPINDQCLECGKDVNPRLDRQELAFDDKDQPRRRCGDCIGKLKNRMPVSNTSGWMDPVLEKK